MENKIYSIGIGPGHEKYLTPQAKEAIDRADVIVGYSVYFEYIRHLSAGKELIDTGMRKERERAEKAFELAENGKRVAVISSGDSGVYGMAPLLYEMKYERNSDVGLEVVPGVSAMFAAAAKLGAPLGHDFCSLSMSDLLTPWSTIEKRVHAAAAADFVTVVYNPVSKGRFWQLMRLKEVFLEQRSGGTPVGIVRNVGRPDEKVTTCVLEELEAEMADMFTVVIIGNSQTRLHGTSMITPRGYYNQTEGPEDGTGRRIMNESFRRILNEINITDAPLDHTWLALHCIHTTADFSIREKLELTGNVVSSLHKKLHSAHPPAIVTDVSMVTRGIRKAIAEDLGLEIKCYLDHERVKEMAEQQSITRTQAGIRIAAEEHPNAIYVFGNAPTALIELVALIRSKKADPAGVIAAPVGFVNVKESKWQLKHGCPDIPAVFIHGRKGGSNVAATIINAILTWDGAKAMYPGEGV
jgi:precorrin-3B C17-methyltransferase